MRRTVRFALVPVAAGLLTLAATGCATTTHALVAAEGPEGAAATVNGVTLVATGDAWEASPDDLPQYVTPVAVELVNNSPYEVRVSFADFSLTDESGLRYAALNPYATARAVGEVDSPATDGLAVLVPRVPPVGDGEAGLQLALDENLAPLQQGVLLAGRHGGGGGGFHGGGGFRGGGGGGFRGGVHMPAPSGGFRGGYHPGWGGYRPGVGVRPGWHGGYYRPGIGVHPGWVGPRFHYGYHGGAWLGYRPFPYYRPWFGLGLTYWDVPFAYPPGYGVWVWGWSPAFYPSASVPDDVIQLGVPEGVLQPGGRINGFLYFQKTHPNAQSFTFTWSVREARQGADLGQATVQLVEVEQ
jgi:hypothetical protein